MQLPETAPAAAHPPRAVLRACGRLLRPHARGMALALGATVAGGLAFGAVDPLVQKFLIDSLGRGRMPAFVAAALLLVTSSTAVRGLGFLSATASQRLKNQVGESLALRMLRAFYRVPFSEVAPRDRGYFATRVFDEPQQVAGDLVDNTLTVARSLVVLAGAASVALWLSWEVTAGVTLVVPFLLARARRSSARIALLTGTEGEAQAVLKDGLGRAVDSYRTVALFGLHERVAAHVGRLLGGYYGAVYQRVRHGAGFQAGSGLFMSAAELVVTLGAAVQVARGELTVGGLFAFMGAYFRVISAANTLVGQVPAIGRLQGALARLDAFERMGDGRPPAAPHPHLELSRLDFAFAGRPLLRDVALRVGAGERVLVTGPNGSGKSTLAHIIAGFLDGEGPVQRRPGQDRVSALLLPFGFIPGTVGDNVGYAEMSEQVRARFLSLARLFGVDGRLDRDPCTLSQGEQRKLQVILTLLKDADLYLFDEPLSNVDAASKPVVMEAIFSITAGRGLVIIMHGDDEYRP
ncbi:MAG: ATP-binding cassette domain-containing protein, partial [Longimicrobiaceae bacterium]